MNNITKKFILITIVVILLITITVYIIIKFYDHDKNDVVRIYPRSQDMVSIDV